MKIIFKVLILGFAILLFGCSKKVESTEPSNSATDKKLSAESLEGEKAKTPNIVNVPFEFKGVKLGQTVKEYKQVFKGLTDISNDKYEIYACIDSNPNYKCDKIKGLTIANQVPTFANFQFLEKKLILIAIDFNPDYFDTVRDAFKQKYGDPTKADETTLSNKLTGVESKYEHLVWTNDNGDKLEITNNEKKGSSYSPKGTLVISTNLMGGLNSDSSDDDGKDI